MIAGFPSCWRQGLATLELLGSTLLVGLHALIVPDLGGEVGVGNGYLRREMGNQVGIVDYPVSLRDACLDIVSQQLIAYSGLPEGVEGVAVTKDAVDVQAGDGGQS